MTDFTPQPVKGPENEQIKPASDQTQLTSDIQPMAESQSKFARFYSENKWYMFAIIVGLVVIGVLAVVAFWPRKQERTEAAKVQLTVDSAETAPAGGEIIYKIKILNQDSAKLVDMNLELVYDSGVTYVSSTPKAENISGTSFSVPDLANGQNAALIIKVNAQGSVNEEKKLLARLRYRFDNFNSPFSQESVFTTKLVAADVVLDISGPEQTNSGEEVGYDIFYRNSSDKDIDNARIQVTFPDSFKPSQSDPPASLSNNVWNLSTLKANQSGKISVKGMYTSSPGQSYNLKVDLLALDDQGDYFTQSSTNFTTSISTQPISVEVKTSSVKDGVVDPGGQVSAEVNYRNNTQTLQTGVQVVVELDTFVIIPGSIQTENGYIQDQTITWNGASSSSLEKLGPGESGKLRFQFKVKDPATDGGDKNLFIKILPRVKSNQNLQFMSGSKLELKIASPAELTQAVSHAGGSLPPKVGQSSSFKVRFSILNSSNDLSDGILQGFIPVGVNLDQNSITQQEKNSVKFDSSTGKLTWNVGPVPAHSGQGQPERYLEFIVSTTPSLAQLNQALNLFKTVSFSAKDSFTGQGISQDITAITTNNIGGSQGRVTN